MTPIASLLSETAPALSCCTAISAVLAPTRSAAAVNRSTSSVAALRSVLFRTLCFLFAISTSCPYRKYRTPVYHIRDIGLAEGGTDARLGYGGRGTFQIYRDRFLHSVHFFAIICPAELSEVMCVGDQAEPLGSAFYFACSIFPCSDLCDRRFRHTRSAANFDDSVIAATKVASLPE